MHEPKRSGKIKVPDIAQTPEGIVSPPCYSNDAARFQEDLLNIARTTLSSKLLTHHKDHFAKLAVDAVMRLKGSGNLEAIHVIKKLGGSLTDSYLDEGQSPLDAMVGRRWIAGSAPLWCLVWRLIGCFGRGRRAGFLLDKKIGVNQPKRLENVNILVANTGMDTDKIKVHTHTHTHACVQSPDR